jgi:solute:Na+ symporter, SSS family
MISLSTIDILLICAYFAAVLFIGFRARSTTAASDSAEFLLAGRSLTTPVFVMTLVSTWYGGILGVGEFTYTFGISNWVVQGIPYYIFAIIFAFLLAKRVRATQLATIPDKLEQAYGRPTALLGAFLTFLLMTPAAYVLMLGALMEVVTGWNLVACIILGTLATTVYLFSGGFRADVATDILEFLLMFVGFAVIIPFAVLRYGGLSFLAVNLPSAHLTWNGGNTTQFILVWFFIALWTLVDPSFHQRCYAARTGEVARNGILWSVVFWIFFDAMTATAGLYARAALPNLQQPMMAYPLFAEAILPPVAKGMFFIGLLATIMSTLNTLAFVSATTLGRDILLRMKWKGTPPSGAAEGGRTTVNETAWVRGGLVVSGILAVVLAVVIPSVIKLWYTIGTVIVPGLLVPLVTSYFDRAKMPPRWAFASMLCGWLTSLVWLLAGWSRTLGATDNYPLGIEPMYPGLAVSLLLWGIGKCGGGSHKDAGETLSSRPPLPQGERGSRG